VVLKGACTEGNESPVAGFTTFGKRFSLWSMRIACWISKFRDTNPEYVNIIDFPQ
jgi:hypothetical protein